MDTKSLLSIGRACTVIQSSPELIRAAALDLSIEPALKLNGTLYFSEADLGHIASFLRKQKQDATGLRHRAKSLR